MASTYVAGVFLAISTYNGPQFIYHCYDESVLEGLHYDEDSEDGSDGEIVWSDDSISSTEEDEAIIPVSSGGGNPRPSIVGSHKSDSQIGGGAGSLNSSKARNELSSVPKLPPNGGSAYQTSTSPLLPAASGTQRRNEEHADSTSESKSTTNASSSKGSNTRTHTNGSQNSHSTREPTDTIFGFERDFLAEMLCPPQSMCNERFCLAIDDCILVGIPIHILESGTWRALKSKKQTASSSSAVRSTHDDVVPNMPDKSKSKESNRSSMSHSSSRVSSPTSSRSSSRSSSHSSSHSPPRSPSNSTSHSPASYLSPHPPSPTLQFPPKSPNGILNMGLPKPLHSGDENMKVHIDGVTTEKDSPMRMFHVAFALIPPITEASLCEERVYQYILVPFVRMLRNEQASRNYVWEQVVKMQKAREETRSLSLSIQQQAIEEASELARALKNLFRAMTQMNIARIMVGNKARAFQVPLQLELSQLPNRFEKISPHTYLATSNLSSKEIKHDSLGSYGLLLLDDPVVIVQEIEVDPQGPVAAMIRSIDPTSSVEQLAKQNKIDLKQIVSLVWSLVYWRRARIIIPLSHRHTYGVSPLAPIGAQFQDLAMKFREIFPMMPPLQRLLSNLSTGKPKPYMFQVPSADHRGIYMRALAWLLQNDFAIHLPTFALVAVTRKIKLATGNSDERGSDTSESAIEDDTRPSSDAHNFKPRRHSSYRMDIDEIQDSIIGDPRKASSKEKRWLAQIAVSGATRNGELATLFQRLMKYFNGLDCLEQIMIHENVSSVDMRRLLQEFSQYIVTFRHW